LSGKQAEPDQDLPAYNRAFPLPEGVKPKLPFGRVSAPTVVAGPVQTSLTFEGIDFIGSSCGCLPPDTVAAVGNNYVVEAVNVQIRVYDKTTGAILLDQPLSTFFGAPSGGDPYVVYDDIANRWYVSAFNGSDTGLFLAVSNDGNPLDGFVVHELTSVGGFPDYQKMGYNKDAIFISYNDFGSGGGAAAIAAIDKAAALSGSLVYYVSSPLFQFRAMPPAQMHGDTTGGVEWFVSTDGTDGGGNTIRVTKMQNYLSPSPTFDYTSLPVTQYGQASFADQPGGTVNVFPNTTTTQVHYRNAHLVTAMASGQAADGYVYPKGLYYQVDISGPTPALLREGLIDPGTGVAVQMITVDEDASGNLGFTWMESSTTEFLSMWVGSVDAGGTLSASVAAPGGGFFYQNFRTGDYSSIVVDPTDNATFWAANEYIGSDGDTDIWRTHIASFSLGMSVSQATPANGAIVSATPTEYILTFSAPYDPSAVNVGGVLVNGIPADSYTVIDSRTISFKFAANPVTSQGLQQFVALAGTVKRLSDGDPLRTYNSTFRYDVLRMQVTSTVPANNAIVTLPLTSLVVTLNEACAPASVSAASLNLSMGTVQSFQLVNPTTVSFQLAGITTEGTLYFSLPAGAFTDPYGNPSLPYQASVLLDYGTQPFPLPVAGLKPLGSMIYQTSFSGNVFPAGDTDTFTILVDPGQTITAIVEPLDPSLQPVVTVAGNDGTSSVSATAPAPNKRAVVQTFRTAGNIWSFTAPALYKVIVGGAGGTTGRYDVRLILNAAGEMEEYDGPRNDTLATAQSLENAFLTLDSTAQIPQRAAVLGRTQVGVQPGDAFIGVRSFGFFGGTVRRYTSAGELAQTIVSSEFDRGVISDVELGPGENVYVALSTDFFSGSTVKGEIAKFDLSGRLLGIIPLPDDPANIGYLYPFGFDVAPDGTLWVPQLNSGNVIHLDTAGNLIASYPVGLQPQDATVTPSGNVLISFFDFNTGTPKVIQLDPSSGGVSDFIPFAYSPVELNATPDGGVWLGNFYDAEKYDASGLLSQQVWEYGCLDAQQDPAGNVWSASFFNGIAKYDALGNFLFRQFAPDGDALGLAVAGVDSTDPLPPPQSDFYSFKLKAGQTATVVVSLSDGSTVNVELQNSAGAALLAGNATTSADCVLQDYVATATGTYYAKVSGSGRYSLVVLRNAEFGAGNHTMATALPLLAPSASVPHRALGYTASGSVDFSGGFASPDGLSANGAAQFTGNVGRLTDGGFGEAGSFFTTYRVGVAKFSTTFTFRMTPGTVPMADGLTFTIQGNGPTELGPAGGGLGYGPDQPYAGQGIRNSIAVKFDVYDNAGEGVDSTGLFTDGRSPTVPEFGSPDILVDLTGTGIDLSSQDVFRVDMDYDGTVLKVIITDTVTQASASQTYTIDIPGQIGDQTGFVGFTGGTGGLTSVQDILSWSYSSSQATGDFYSVKLLANKPAFISTTTPAGSTGQFVNNLDPIVLLYDATGRQVAVSDNDASDRRNAKLRYVPPTAGTYYILVGASPSSPGPTHGEYILMQSQ
jgi:hypothetical protein